MARHQANGGIGDLEVVRVCSSISYHGYYHGETIEAVCEMGLDRGRGRPRRGQADGTDRGAGDRDTSGSSLTLIVMIDLVIDAGNAVFRAKGNRRDRVGGLVGLLESFRYRIDHRTV
jgi:hypothetical protein